ncbi:hypothetical protein [Rhodopseudomonas sp. RCAM05734]|uniref:hypothetical protein n=1 Tax=Rhodopseudomonas sp. RCAM05734 TaxID=3457549 RepID=UPI0040439A8C
MRSLHAEDFADDDDVAEMDRPLFDPLVALNSCVYFAASLQLGAVWWKATLIAVIIAVLTWQHYGHRALARLGVLLLVLTLALWSDILPPVQQWQALIASMTGRTA